MRRWIKSYWYWYNLFLWYGYSHIDSALKAVKVKNGEIVRIDHGKRND